VTAFTFAFDNAGSNIAARMAMMAITTNNSINVNAARRTSRLRHRAADFSDCAMPTLDSKEFFISALLALWNLQFEE
jgi:hypothetical protein